MIIIIIFTKVYYMYVITDLFMFLFPIFFPNCVFSTLAKRYKRARVLRKITQRGS